MLIARLSGMRALPSKPALTTPFQWTSDPDRPPPHALAPVALGSGERGCLFVDLALAPGLITIGGNRRVRDEFGAELVNRLGAAARGENDRPRYAVVVAGQPFDPDLLVVEPTRVPSLAALEETELAPGIEARFVACALESADDVERIHALAAAKDRRTIPVLVDDIVSSAWSVFAPIRPLSGLAA